MNSISTESLLTALRWRYATKKFDSTRTIPAETWSALEQALILSPSSFGLQPWKFIVITDPALKTALVPASWGQSQPRDCSHLVVLTVRKGLNHADVDRYLQCSSAITGRPLETLAGYRSVVTGYVDHATAKGTLDDWSTRQVYIALGQFMASAAVIGVDTCPLEGIDPAKYDEILGLKGSGYATVVGCAAGYRSAEDGYGKAPKVRFAASELIVRR